MKYLKYYNRSLFYLLLLAYRIFVCYDERENIEEVNELCQQLIGQKKLRKEKMN
ncbi:hypothetical protein EMIT019CA3_10171 [Bacillus pseudomycoides]